MVDFIGIGAQKAGTSWVYACLYEHPEICAPIKELHFFSRDRFAKGYAWYESHFDRCAAGKKRGEFSTSYLYDEATPARIKAQYPEARLIAIVREPLCRAYSQYGNAIKGGEIAKDTSFAAYAETEPSCLAQGLYTQQLQRYDEHFATEQLLVLVYEDSTVDPLGFMQRIYRHIGVDDTFVPPSLNSRINVARVPKQVGIDRLMHRTAEWLRRHGLDGFVHRVKRLGVTDLIRSYNTETTQPDVPDYDRYTTYYDQEVAALEARLNRDLKTVWYEKSKT